MHLRGLLLSDAAGLLWLLAVVSRLMTIYGAWIVLLGHVRLVLTGTGGQWPSVIEVISRDCVGRKRAPFAIRAFFDLLRRSGLRHALRTSLFISINLHHIDTGQVLLHLLAIFDTFAVNDVVDVLNLVRTHASDVLLRGRVPQDRLIYRWQLVVLICTRWNKPLLTWVAAILTNISSDTANLRQLQLWFAVVSFEATRVLLARNVV